MLNTYLVAFDDEECYPWVKVFHCSSLEDVKDKIIDYVINKYDLSKMPLDYKAFTDKCADDYQIFIGEIKETDEF